MEMWMQNKGRNTWEVKSKEEEDQMEEVKVVEYKFSFAYFGIADKKMQNYECF